MREEVLRRIVHACGAFPVVGYLLGLVSWPVTQVLLVAGAGIALVLEAIRLFVGLDWAIYERLTREYERENLAGYALYMFSVAATVLVFPPRIAVPATLMLAWADPVSGLLGTGELRTVKRAPVLAAMFATCLLIAWPFTGPLPAALGALAATLADGVKPVFRGYVIDDNLTIPPTAALAMAAGVAYLPAT